MEELNSTYLEIYENSWKKLNPNLDPKYNLFDYSRSEYFDLYDNLYKFIYDNIQQSEGFNIKPLYFFFNNSEELDAKAISRSQAITINRGLIEKLIKYFHSYSDFLQGLPYEAQPNLVKNLDVPVYYLIFQSVAQFLYYHELAHIIQYSENDDKRTFTENQATGESEEYDFVGHIMEMDADELAAHYVANHISDMWIRKLPKEAQTADTLGMLISLFGAGVYTLFYVLKNEDFPDYYENEQSHPHPVIRFNAVMLKVIGTFQVFHERLGLKFDRAGVLRQANVIMRHMINEEAYLKSESISKGKLQNIAVFLKNQQQEFIKRPWLAGNKLMAKQQRR